MIFGQKNIQKLEHIYGTYEAFSRTETSTIRRCVSHLQKCQAPTHCFGGRDFSAPWQELNHPPMDHSLTTNDTPTSNDHEDPIRAAVDAVCAALLAPSHSAVLGRNSMSSVSLFQIATMVANPCLSLTNASSCSATHRRQLSSSGAYGTATWGTH